jgi:hypothetical protein
LEGLWWEEEFYLEIMIVGLVDEGDNLLLGGYMFGDHDMLDLSLVADVEIILKILIE